MFVLLFALSPGFATLALAETGTDDTGDTADTDPEGRDTAPFEDTASAEEVFVQDVGCGGSAASIGVLGVLGALGLARGKRE